MLCIIYYVYNTIWRMEMMKANKKLSTYFRIRHIEVSHKWYLYYKKVYVIQKIITEECRKIVKCVKKHNYICTFQENVVSLRHET